MLAAGYRNEYYEKDYSGFIPPEIEGYFDAAVSNPAIPGNTDPTLVTQ